MPADERSYSIYRPPSQAKAEEARLLGQGFRARARARLRLQGQVRARPGPGPGQGQLC
jgi:hypothetical protein